MATATVKPGKQLHLTASGPIVVDEEGQQVLRVDLFVAPNGTVTARPVEEESIDQDGSVEHLNPVIRADIDQA